MTLRGRGGFFVALALASIMGAAFWLPAVGVSRGWFPAPLDDVYIHFDYARSLARLRPFEWLPGQGYSSGETSPLYALLLAMGFWLGFHARALGVWAALVAVLSVAVLLERVRRMLRPCPAWLAWALAALPLSIGVVDWTLFSGMEVAPFVAALACALTALARTRARRSSSTREALQWKLGAWGAVLVLLRPEAAVIVAIFAIAAARGAGPRSVVAALLRASLPGAIATVAVLGANLIATGDARSAGAQLKLLSSNPYLSDVDRARAFVENLVTFWLKVVRAELSPRPALGLILPLLSLVGLVERRYRTVVGASLLSAVGWILIVSWNGNAPHHNFRYYVPALVLVAISASIGLATLARSARKRGLSTFLGASAFAIGATTLPAQIRFFRAACANIRDQHIEVGERVARLPSDAKILLGDAGAIPYVSGRTAVDALGLGGYRGAPFARAAVHGEPATIELIERLAPSERPTHFALYPNWFGALTSRFGVELDRVTIENNVICGSPTKAIYLADWSSLQDSRGDGLESAEPIDEVDVGDIVDEAAHGYLAPLPHGGWTTLDVLEDASGARRFDGGRIIPDGKRESFVVKRGSRGPITLRVRIDAAANGIAMRTSSTEKALTLDPVREGAWRTAVASLDGIEAGETITLEARGGAYRNYHVWIDRAATASPQEEAKPWLVTGAERVTAPSK